jgi:hypothetical protein
VDGDDDATRRLGTLRTSWLGHSAVLLELDGVRLLSPKTVETHIARILAKLDLHQTPDEHRRVLAVLAWLRG